VFARIIRSPLFSLFIWWYVLAAYYFTFFSPSEPSEQLKRIVVVIVILVPLLLILIQITHNKKHPENPISFKRSFLPWEFREVDEGQKWLTYNACRNVYIYYSLALPISVAFFAIFQFSSYTPIVLIGLLGTGQYLVYWLTIRKLEQM
jgi:hypothetical protein